MEALLQELVYDLKHMNDFSWQDAINILALLASWITIWFLLKDKMEANRPFMQISFELIRSSLACVVLRNTGNVPISIRELKFDDNFIKQLPDIDYQRLINNNINNMVIFPGKQWVICLGVIVPDILNYENTILNIDYTYGRLKRKKVYSEHIGIDFKQYAKCLVYISEIDELREVNRKMAQDIKSLGKVVQEIRAILIQYSNIEDTTKRSVLAGYEVKKQKNRKRKKNKE